MTPVVSICCITYNHHLYLEECMEGFLMQKTNFPIEILIHDDASTDGTTEIVKSYAERFPDIIIPTFQTENQFSKGVKITPILLKKARGKYIALCEGDDYWTDPLKLQKQVDFLEENEEYVICYSNASIVDEKNNLLEESKLPLNSQRDFDENELKKGAFVLTLTSCFKNIIKEFPKEYNKAPNGDTFLFSLLGHYGKGKYMDNIDKSVYRKHSGGVWGNIQEERKLSMHILSFLLLSKFYKKNKDRDISLFYSKVRLKKINKLISFYRGSPNRKQLFKCLFVLIKDPNFNFGKPYSKTLKNLIKSLIRLNS